MEFHHLFFDSMEDLSQRNLEAEIVLDQPEELAINKKYNTTTG